MLYQLPYLCQLEVLSKLPPTSIESCSLINRHFYCLIQKCRKSLPKPKVFMSATQELDKEHVTVCFYLHPIHYNGDSSYTIKHRIYRQIKVKYDDLESLVLEQHFGHFELESILLTSRFMQMTRVNEKLLSFVKNSVVKHASKLRYFAVKCLDFKSLDSRTLVSFLDAFESMDKCLDVFKLQSCHFLDTTAIYSILTSSLLTRTRHFKELCSTKENPHDDGLIYASQTISSRVLSTLTDVDSRLESLDTCSVVHWPASSVTSFVENWCQTKAPKMFKKLSLMKTDNFGRVVDSLRMHPWAQAQNIEPPEPLHFKNRHNQKLELTVFWDSPLYFVMTTIDSEAARSSAVDAHPEYY